MELGDLRTLVRIGLDDTVVPYLHDDATVNRALNNAVREACLRTRQIQDDASAVCRIATVVDQPRYTLDPTIFVVRAAHVSTRREPLILTTAGRLDRLVPGWSHEALGSDLPKYALFDVAQKTLTVHPAPSTAGTLFLRVWRTPLEAEAMEDDSDEPVLVLPDAEELKHWAIYECLLNPDAEAGDIKKAADHLGLFTERFGDRPSANDLQLWSTQRIVGTRMSSEL